MRHTRGELLVTEKHGRGVTGRCEAWMGGTGPVPPIPALLGAVRHGRGILQSRKYWTCCLSGCTYFDECVSLRMTLPGLHQRPLLRLLVPLRPCSSPLLSSALTASQQQCGPRHPPGTPNTLLLSPPLHSQRHSSAVVPATHSPKWSLAIPAITLTSEPCEIACKVRAQFAA